MADENCAARANRQETPALRRGKTVEQIYQKKTQLEHILLRPDTYVGSTEHQLQEMWVFDDVQGKMVHRKIDYVPALYKIFDEILVNAADNSMRDPKGMDLIDVTIDRQAGSISVLNNGQGIPVQVHKEHKCYVPELIFGHLLTSDNYDDNEKKVTGGRNGYGAKLANVFSKKFTLETADRQTKKKFVQVFENNMQQKNPPKVTDFTGSEYTRVTFWPDFARFGMSGLDTDITSLMMKRVYDVAGSTNKKVRVVLNGKQLQVKNFQDYVALYLGESAADCLYEKCQDRWEVAVSFTDGSFQQVSFVNSINTIKGGTHVTHVTDQLVEALLKVVKGKNRGGIDIKPAHVRNHLWVFINCLIENPAFDSQTKETLTTKQSKFGSSCELSDTLMKKVLKSGVVDMILSWVRAKEKVDMSKQLRGTNKNTTRVLGIPKLEDANDAGGKHSDECTLILTEGDSAKSLAVAGLSVVGRDKFGVFPLKGKVLNVRDANFKQVTGNAEIQNLMKIVGLDLKCEYNNTNKLRYGSIMLMTDQDHDGSHIKGLLINLLHFWWPSLVRMDGFVKEFITPIVKVWKDGKKDSERRDETSFFTVSDYEAWKARTNNGRGWKSKYYKGLGTSTMKEAKEYFRDIEQHEIKFRWQSDNDGEAIDLAFNKKRADDRKDWINGYVDGTNVDHSKSVVGYSDFIHKELVQFAKYDVSRSVPCMVDGFKPSQRKVIFCAFKKKLKNDIKVAQFVGYISEQSAYHHGEVSLENTIVNLAQNFVGSNNVNLLIPSGQFGTRLQGGKDHAAARYIYTRLNVATRVLFHPDDDHVLSYLNEEGMSIEPQWYCPILPTVLVNGADGIGVGWSTFIPNYDTREIIGNMRRMLRGCPMQEMHPRYKGFRGEIVPNEREWGKYDITGVITKTSETTLEITELPVKTWTQSYKEFLEELLPQDGKKGGDDEGEHTIEEFREHHTESTVHFVLTLTKEKMRQVEQAGLMKTFKLKSSIAITNMVLFDAEGKIAKYNSALDILTDFCSLRRKVYVERKAYLEAKLTREKEILSNKARFIKMVVDGELELRRKKKAELLRELKQLGFTPMSQLDAIMKGRGVSAEEPEAPGRNAEGENDEADQGVAEKKSEYDYLLGMNLWSLTWERVQEILKQLEAKKEELRILQETTIEQIWDRDLEAFLAALDDMEALEEEEAAAAASAAQGRKRKRGGRAAAAPAPPPLAAPQPGRSTASRAAKAANSAFLSQPLSSTLHLGEVNKTTWGVDSGPTSAMAEEERGRRKLQRAASNSAMAVSDGEAQGPGKGRRRGRSPSPSRGGSGTIDLSNSSLSVPPPEPASRAPLGGAALLSRLIQRQGGGSEGGGGGGADGGPGMGTFGSSAAELGGSEDLFAYLHSGSGGRGGGAAGPMTSPLVAASFPSYTVGGAASSTSWGAGSERTAGSGPHDPPEGGAAPSGRGRGGRGRGSRGGRGRGRGAAKADRQEDAAEAVDLTAPTQPAEPPPPRVGDFARRSLLSPSRKGLLSPQRDAARGAGEDALTLLQRRKQAAAAAGGARGGGSAEPRQGAGSRSRGMAKAVPAAAVALDSDEEALVMPPRSGSAAAAAAASSAAAPQQPPAAKRRRNRRALDDDDEDEAFR